MICPFCGYEDSKVIDTRPMDMRIRRRRECTRCAKRFTTFETTEKPLLMVHKKDGSFEPFDRSKLIRGIYNAIKKRPINVEQVNQIVDNIENYYANALITQAAATEIVWRTKKSATAKRRRMLTPNNVASMRLERKSHSAAVLE